MLAMTTSVAGPSTWIPTDDSFGARLALVRQRMGWNIAKAARECGLNDENWRLWEQLGREPARLTTVAKQIATRTGCEYLWLVHGPDRGQLPPRPPVTRAYQTRRLAPTEDEREGRVIERGIRHGDSRRKGTRKADSLVRSASPEGPRGSTTRPVSRLAVA